MEREYEGLRAVETGCRGGQGSLRPVVPNGRKDLLRYNTMYSSKIQPTFQRNILHPS
jgi:hypothetical protein